MRLIWKRYNVQKKPRTKTGVILSAIWGVEKASHPILFFIFVEEGLYGYC